MSRRAQIRRTVAGIVAGAGLLVPAVSLSTSAATRSPVPMGAPPAAAAPGLRLPDLVADPPAQPILESYSDAAGDRLLLRFHGYVHNVGTGALELRASQPRGSLMTAVAQRLYDEDGHLDLRADPAPTVIYERDDSHDHWHLLGAARYSLWDERRTHEVAPATKAGFCLLDSQRMEAWGSASPAYTRSRIAFCQQGLPSATAVTMGVSPGWRDVYGRSLAYQWVDVSDVAPGSYWLSSEVDPAGVVIESQEANARAFASRASIVPGYRARSFARRVDPLLLIPATIDLPVDRYGSAGGLEYRIEEAPRVGVLDRPVGRWFRGSSVSYTAPWSYQGQDSFRFSARSAQSPFPRTPVEATASLGVRTDPVARTRHGTGRSSGVEHSEPSAEARRAPSLAGPAPRVADGLVAAPQVHVDGSDVLLRSVTLRPGILHLRARAAGAALGGCRVPAPAGRVVTCLLEEDAPVPAANVTAIAGLRLQKGDVIGRAVAPPGSARQERHLH